MGTPTAGLRKIAGEGEKDERYKAWCEHCLTMVPCQMQHGHENSTILGAQGSDGSFHRFCRMDMTSDFQKEFWKQKVGAFLHFGNARMVLLGSLQDSDAPSGLASKAGRLANRGRNAVCHG